jgi:hypothetical protein
MHTANRKTGTARALGWNRTLTLLQEIRGVKGQRPFSAAELDPLRRDERAIGAAAQAQGIYLRRLGELPASGPVVVSKHTHLPYTAHEFRRRWRIIANVAGVPNKVFNMDSRAGVETILARCNDPDYRARRKAEILRRAGRNEDDEAAN